MPYKSDDQIKSEVLFQLGWDTRVEQTEVGVTVNKGVVTLTGIVDSYPKKIVAQEAAHRVRGVLDVANDLGVKVPGGSRHTDSEIAQTIRHAMESNVLVPSDQIQTTVSNGWVILEGNVEHYSERVGAERAVREHTGVSGVTNQIKVTTMVDPGRVRFLRVRFIIEDVLDVRADREAQRIMVKVEEGEVTHRRSHLLE